MSHKHICLNCEIVVAEGNFDCERDSDHDFALCDNCAERKRLNEDIQILWDRGYISRDALSIIPVARAGVDPEPVITIEMMREVLRRAGYSDKQIDDRDYSYPTRR